MRSAFVHFVLASGLAVTGFAQILPEAQRLEAVKHYEAGQELMHKETFEEAAGEFKTALTFDPDYVLAHYSLGQAYMSLKRYPDAVTAYTNCRDVLQRQSNLDQKSRTQLDQQYQDELRELRDSLQRVRSGQLKGVSIEHEALKIEERIRVVENASHNGREERFQVPADVSLALGSAYLRSGQLPEAERSYLEATQADPKMGSAYNNLAVVYMLTSRLDEAEKSLKRAEKAGFPVSPQLKKDIESRKQAASK
jgi:tetratricopeptide (TPR) repeat protein